MLTAFKSGFFRRVSPILVGGVLAYVPLTSLGQTNPAATPSKPTASLADSLHRGGDKQLHIFYVHGIGSDGPKDYDSWKLRRGICEFVQDCVTPAGELDEKQREYADQDEFTLNTEPPALEYLGQRVWQTPKEWNAAAPYVVHWKLARSSGPTIYVDEINWWPLVFSLKCRQIVRSDTALVGPSPDRIKLCSTLQPDPTDSDRFISYDWIPNQDAPGLLALASNAALVNRKLKNGLLDWGFSDALLALGPLRTYLLDGIRQLILKSVAVAPNGSRGGPATPRANQEYVIVSHSLGSYLIFAALEKSATVPAPAVQESTDAFGQILARTPLVYFFANQLRLLELANLDATSGKNLVSQLEAWGRLRCNYLKSLPGSMGTCGRPQIVALNDPSDLLTWTIPEQLASVDPSSAPVEVHNVSVKNAPHWLWLFERPTKAHDDYARSKSAIRQMLTVEHN